MSRHKCFYGGESCHLEIVQDHEASVQGPVVALDTAVEVTGYMNNWGGRGAGFGWGSGFGRGFGRGAAWGWGYGAAYVPPTYTSDPKARASALRAQADELKVALDNINRELDSMDKQDAN